MTTKPKPKAVAALYVRGLTGAEREAFKAWAEGAGRSETRQAVELIRRGLAAAEQGYSLETMFRE